MKRRDLLTLFGAAISSSVAGCLGGGNPIDGTNETTDTTTTTSTDTTTGTTDTDAMIRDTSFEVETIEQQSQDENAVVSVDGQTVTVTGTIWGRNGCYTARLGDVGFTDGTLVVAIESYEDRDDDEACTEANVYIDYTATIELDTEPPGEIRVTHNGEQIQTE